MSEGMRFAAYFHESSLLFRTNTGITFTQSFMVKLFVYDPELHRKIIKDGTHDVWDIDKSDIKFARFLDYVKNNLPEYGA